MALNIDNLHVVDKAFSKAPASLVSEIVFWRVTGLKNLHNTSSSEIGRIVEE